MASNIEKLGGYIKDKAVSGAQNFAFGAKAAFYSGNPAMFGAIESGISNLKKSFNESKENESKQSRREQAEQRRQRGFQEEQAREQRYNELQQQKIFESMDENIKKILELLGKSSDRGFDASPLLASLGLGSAGLPKPKPTDPELRRVRAIDPEFKKIRGLGVFDDILKSMSRFRDGLFRTNKGLLKGVSAIEDMSKSLVEQRKVLLERFGPQFSKSGKLLGGAALDSRLGKLAEEAKKLPTLGMDTAGAGAADEAAKGFNLAESIGDASKAFSAEGSIGKVFRGIGNFSKGVGAMLAGPLKFVAEITDAAAFAKGIGKVLGPIGVIFGIFDGIMMATDTEKLQKLLGEDIGIQQRISGFIGGFLGSVGGLFDLLAKLMNMDIEGGSIQDRLTSNLTVWFDDIFKELKIIFEGIGTFLQSEPVQIVFEYIKDMGTNFMQGILSIFKLLAGLVTLDTDKMKEAGIDLLGVVKNSFIMLGNAVVDMINYVIRQLNDVLPDSWAIEELGRFTESGPMSSWTEKGLIDEMDKTRNQYIEAKEWESTRKARDKALTDEMAKILDEVKLLDLQIESGEFSASEVFGKKNKKRALLDEYTRMGVERGDARSGSMPTELKEAFDYYNQLMVEAKVRGDAKKSGSEQSSSGADGADPVGTLQSNTPGAPQPPEPPKEEQPPTLKDTEDQKTEIIESNKEGAEEIVDNAAAISESEKAAEDARHAVSMEAAAANYRLQEALNAKLNGWLSQQNEMVRALFGLLGRGGGEGGGFLGKISGLFKGDGPLKGVGDFLGNVFGKGSGGWFDKASGWFGGLKDAFGEITDTFGGVGGALEELLGGGSGGTMIFNTPGFGGPMSTGNPFMDILGGGISEKLGLSGVGTNAVADLARNFMSSSPQSFGSVLKGQGGIGGGIGSIMTLKNADINTLGGAVSGGLALYQLHKGGGLGNMVIDGVNKFAEKLLENNAESIIGNKLKSFMSGKMGTVVKKFGGAFQAYATAEFLSGGYAVNKHLNKIAAVVSMIPGVGQIAGVVAGVVNRLFGRKPKEYKDYGLDLNMGAQTTGQQYKDWVKKGGVYRSDKKGTDYENLDQEMLDGLSQAAVSVQEGYGALAEVMGMSAESIKGFTKDYKISLKDLSPEEQQKKIAELIQTYAKDAIKASYGNVSRYSLQGEDTLKTFERLASATESVSYWFDALGYSVEETTDMFKKAGENLTSGGSGNIAGDLFNVDWTTSGFYRKAMMGGREDALTQYNEFMAGGMYDMSNFVGPYGPMNWMSGYYTPELSEEQKKNQEALALAGAKANFVQMVGGDEQFAQAMQSYFTGFYSQEEQAEFMARQATKMAQAQLEAVQDQIAQLTNQFEGIDPNLAQKLEGITSREQIEEAKAEYRKAIEAAMESGDMELAAELLKSAEIFVQAGEMQLEAARLRGEAKGGFDISDYQIGVAAVGSAFGINVGAGGIAEDNSWLADQIVEAIPFMEESSTTVTPADAQSTSTADVNSVVAADNSVTNTVVNNNAPAAFDPTLLNLREFHPVLSGGLRGIPFGFNINITGM